MHMISASDKLKKFKNDQKHVNIEDICKMQIFNMRFFTLIA